MIYTNSDKNVRKVVIECDCGCASLEFSQWKDDGIVFVGFNEDAFRSHQRPIRMAVRQYLKRLWSAIVGKDFLFFDLSIIHKKTLVELKNAINLLDENLLNQ